jgi:hypothetical protein
VGKKNPTLKPFLKIVRSKPYIDRIYAIQELVQDVVVANCAGFSSCSGTHACHDIVAIGTKEDIEKWCQAHGNDMHAGTGWLFSNHLLINIISTNILGDSLINHVAETLQSVSKLTKNPSADLADFVMKTVLDGSLDNVVAKYLCETIIWATPPKLEGRLPGHVLSRYRNVAWFKTWISTNCVNKPAPGGSNQAFPNDQQYTNVTAQKVAKQELTAMVHREYPSPSVGYVGSIKLVDESHEEDLNQVIRQEYGHGEYKVYITKRNHGTPSASHIVKVIHITVFEDKKKPEKPHIMLPPAKTIPLHQSADSKQPQVSTGPKDADEKEAFAAAISGSLFKKPIEEP